jgi:hypothetical protein
MKTSKIDGHFRIYVAFFGAKKEVIEFLNSLNSGDGK